MKVPSFDSCTSFGSPVGNINVYAKGESVVFLTMGDVSCGESGKAKVLSKAEIAKLGFGQVATYADIANSIGNPKAVRAVGGAVGSNPVPLVVGCHRVLGSAKKITGYSGGDGIPTKKWLLAHEAIEYRD